MIEKTGVITSNKQEKTLIVAVHDYKNHPKYKKRYRVSKKYHVDNPENKKLEIGENVTFFECRPISRLKKWTIVEPKTTTKS